MGSNVPQYPAMFDPSQMLNKYSTMNSSSFPMYNYYGTPTDAQGNPIDAYKAPVAQAPAAPASQGTTLNSLPPLGSQARAMYNAGYGDWSQLDPMMGRSSIPGQADGANNSGGYGAGISGGFGGNQPYTRYNPALLQAAAQPQAPAAPTGADPNNPGFAYLLGLAHPNKVVTPGVAAPPRTNQPGNFDIDALIAKMQANSGAGGAGAMAPGGYGAGATGLASGGVAPSSNFLNTLAALRAGSPGAK